MPPSPQHWFSIRTAEKIDINLPAVYVWTIEGVGCYVGKSRRLRARLREYDNNVRKILAGHPYRKGKSDGWRRVHLELAAARLAGLSVTLEVVETCGLDELNARERHWIGLRGTLNGRAMAGG
jgi:hypothetical protein